MAENDKCVPLEVSLRPARDKDLAAIKALHALAFTSLAADHHSAEQLEAHQHLIEGPDYDHDIRRSHLMLAVTPTGEIVGSAGWIEVPEEPSTARIRKVFVHPRLARRGLASLLVREAERRAIAAGHTRIIVRSNVNAVPLYRKLGYVPLRSGDMATPSGVALPVLFMEKAGPVEP
jgi:putative acetyltransferase